MQDHHVPWQILHGDVRADLDVLGLEQPAPHPVGRVQHDGRFRDTRENGELLSDDGLLSLELGRVEPERDGQPGLAGPGAGVPGRAPALCLGGRAHRAEGAGGAPVDEPPIAVRVDWTGHALEEGAVPVVPPVALTVEDGPAEHG